MRHNVLHNVLVDVSGRLETDDQKDAGLAFSNDLESAYAYAIPYLSLTDAYREEE